MRVESQGSARYFFSVRYKTRILQDREGVELPADADIGACAGYLAVRLRDDSELTGVSMDGVAIEVTDLRGVVVLSVSVPTA